MSVLGGVAVGFWVDEVMFCEFGVAEEYGEADGDVVGVGMGIAGASEFGVVKNGEKVMVPRLKSFLLS